MNPNANQNANQNANPNANPNANQIANPPTNNNQQQTGQQGSAANSKDFNSMIWQLMDPNQQQQQKTFFDALTNNIQQQQFLQNLFNKQPFNNWLDNSNKNSALSYLNYLNSKPTDKQSAANGGQSMQDAIDKSKPTAVESTRSNEQNNPINPNMNPINQFDRNTTELVKATTGTSDASVQASNLNKDRYVSYDFKQPFIQYNGKDDYYLDENEQDTNSAVIALVLGLFITIMLIVIVGFRMRSIKKRIQRRGGRTSLAHDADYLVNGMYL